MRNVNSLDWSDGEQWTGLLGECIVGPVDFLWIKRSKNVHSGTIQQPTLYQKIEN